MAALPEDTLGALKTNVFPVAKLADLNWRQYVVPAAALSPSCPVLSPCVDINVSGLLVAECTRCLDAGFPAVWCKQMRAHAPPTAPDGGADGADGASGTAWEVVLHVFSFDGTMPPIDPAFRLANEGQGPCEEIPLVVVTDALKHRARRRAALAGFVSVGPLFILPNKQGDGLSPFGFSTTFDVVGEHLCEQVVTHRHQLGFPSALDLQAGTDVVVGPCGLRGKLAPRLKEETGGAMQDWAPAFPGRQPVTPKGVPRVLGVALGSHIVNFPSYLVFVRRDSSPEAVADASQQLVARALSSAMGGGAKASFAAARRLAQKRGKRGHNRSSPKDDLRERKRSRTSGSTSGPAPALPGPTAAATSRAQPAVGAPSTGQAHPTAAAAAGSAQSRAGAGAANQPAGGPSAGLAPSQQQHQGSEHAQQQQQSASMLSTLTPPMEADADDGKATNFAAPGSAMSPLHEDPERNDFALPTPKSPGLTDQQFTAPFFIPTAYQPLELELAVTPAHLRYRAEQGTAAAVPRMGPAALAAGDAMRVGGSHHQATAASAAWSAGMPGIVEGKSAAGVGSGAMARPQSPERVLADGYSLCTLSAMPFLHGSTHASARASPCKLDFEPAAGAVMHEDDDDSTGHIHLSSAQLCLILEACCTVPTTPARLVPHPPLSQVHSAMALQNALSMSAGDEDRDGAGDSDGHAVRVDERLTTLASELLAIDDHKRIKQCPSACLGPCLSGAPPPATSLPIAFPLPGSARDADLLLARVTAAMRPESGPGRLSVAELSDLACAPHPGFCDPLGIPAVVVEHDSEKLALSPLALPVWENLSLQPFARDCDVRYLALVPAALQQDAADFFRDLECVYYDCKLGMHTRATDPRRKAGPILAVPTADDQVAEVLRVLGQGLPILLDAESGRWRGSARTLVLYVVDASPSAQDALDLRRAVCDQLRECDARVVVHWLSPGQVSRLAAGSQLHARHVNLRRAAFDVYLKCGKPVRRAREAKNSEVLSRLHSPLFVLAPRHQATEIEARGRTLVQKPVQHVLHCAYKQLPGVPVVAAVWTDPLGELLETAVLQFGQRAPATTGLGAARGPRQSGPAPSPQEGVAALWRRSLELVEATGQPWRLVVACAGSASKAEAQAWAAQIAAYEGESVSSVSLLGVRPVELGGLQVFGGPAAGEVPLPTFVLPVNRSATSSARASDGADAQARCWVHSAGRPDAHGQFGPDSTVAVSLLEHLVLRRPGLGKELHPLDSSCAATVVRHLADRLDALSWLTCRPGLAPGRASCQALHVDLVLRLARHAARLIAPAQS